MAQSYALISTYDKTGSAALAKALVAQGYGILSTGGTASFLEENGVQVTRIEDFTGQAEILGGRVKSLHPKIHGGILARRENEDDMATLQRDGLTTIDFVVVNLYPFIDQIELSLSEGKKDSLIEFIDIGGPTMIRAAAKNYRDVVVLSDPADYASVIKVLETGQSLDQQARCCLAAKVFATMANYDAAVARYLSLNESLVDEKGKPVAFAPLEALVFQLDEQLRYGENPHQQAAFYREFGSGSKIKPAWTQLQGKELSYNNLVDAEGALACFTELYQSQPSQHCAVIIKHTNPCGAAIAEDNLQAFLQARSCDPISAFGGIIAVSGELTEELADSICDGFVEVVLASSFSSGALTRFSKKKNVRLLECDFDRLGLQAKSASEIKPAMGGYLLQSVDRSCVLASQGRSVAAVSPSEAQLKQLDLAVVICKHVKSNAIVIVNEGKAVGVGAGQMSRVDAARLSVMRAELHGHNLKGAVAASDAFLPFPDTLEVLSDAGVEALVQPGGSLKDQDVIDAANRRKLSLVFTGERHFRH